MHSLSTRSPLPERRRRWLGVAVICLAQLLVVLDASIMNVAMPSVQRALHISESTRQWGVTSYMLAFGALLLLGGRVADHTGRRRAFIVGLAGFAACSTVGGLAANGLMFFATRAGQGAFAALLAPAALALLSTAFSDPADRAKAFGCYGAVFGAGSAAGLIAGGALTALASWRWCMFIAAPFALCAAVAAPRVLEESRTDGARRYDLPGALTAALGLGGLVYGVSAAQEHGWSSAWAWGSFTAALVLLATFAQLQRRGGDPLLPPRVLADRRRVAGMLAVGLGGLAVTGIFLLLSYYLQRDLGMSALATGVSSLPYSAGMAVSAALGGRLLPRTGPLPLIAGGLTVAALGVLLLARVSGADDYLTAVLPGLLVLSLGVGAMFSAASATALDRVPERDSGTAGAVLNSFSEIAGALGSAILATLVTAAGTGPSAAVHGYRTAFVFSAAVLVVGAVAVALLLRERRAAG